MGKEKSTNVFGIFCAVVGALTLLAAGAYFAMKFLKKKKCCCEGEDEIEDCDDTVCIIDEDAERINTVGDLIDYVKAKIEQVEKK